MEVQSVQSNDHQIRWYIVGVVSSIKERFLDLLVLGDMLVGSNIGKPHIKYFSIELASYIILRYSIMINNIIVAEANNKRNIWEGFSDLANTLNHSFFH